MTRSDISPLARLLSGPIRPGLVEWIGVRPARKADMLTPPTINLTIGQGIDGDRYSSRHNGPRQVTLIAAEDIAAIAAFLGRDVISPSLLRRNIVTRGLNLIALKERQFSIGDALLEGSGDCAPCGRMDENLGPGGFNAMRGRGGITARVLRGGEIGIGAVIAAIE